MISNILLGFLLGLGLGLIIKLPDTQPVDYVPNPNRPPLRKGNMRRLK